MDDHELSRRSALQSITALGASSLLPSAASGQSQSDDTDEALGIAWRDVAVSQSSGRGLDAVRTFGGYVLAGVEHSSKFHLDNNELIRKIDLNGNLVWERILHRDGGWTIEAIEQLNGGFLTVSNGYADAGVKIRAYDAYGFEVWEREVAESEDDELFDVAVAEDSIVAVGWRAKEDAPWAIRCTADGIVEWSRTYLGEHEEGAYMAVEGTGDGTCHVLARVRQADRGNNQAQYTRLSLDGTVDTRRLLSERELDAVPFGLVQIEDGGFLATGSARGPNGSDVAWIRKLDESVNPQWTWLNDQGSFNEAKDGIVMPDGSYLVVGSTGLTSHSWAIRIDPDGAVRWKEQYRSQDSNEFNAAVRSPGGAMAVGTSWTEGTNDWPNPVMARLSPLSEAQPDGFDPRIHGFGFANWAGESGLTAEGERFTLPYEGVSKDDAENWIRGLDSPIERGYDLWDGSKTLVSSLGNRMYSTGGHCSGMVHAADYYYHNPSALPRTVSAANEVPSPTGEYRYIGDRIREMQFLPEHGLNAYVDMTRMGAPKLELPSAHEKILEAIDRTGTSAIALNIDGGGKHAVLGYEYRKKGESIEILYYDPNLRAEDYLSKDNEAGVDLDQPGSDEDRAFEDPRRKLVIDSQGDILESTIPLINYAYLPQKAIPNAYDSTEQDEVKSLIETLQLPAPDVDSDDDVVPDAEPISIFRLDSPAADLSVTTPEGAELPTLGTGWAAEDLVEYDKLAWDFGTDPSDYTVEVSGDIGEDYSLDVKGMIPDGGHVSSTITGTFSGSQTHEIRANVPESGEGSVEIVDRPDPVENGAGTGEEHTTTGGAQSEATANGSSASSGSGAGTSSGWSAEELAAVAGVFSLVSLGYYAKTRE